MQTVPELNDAFGLDGVLAFDEPHAGMPRARITTPACTAELYLQGAHLALWQPTLSQPADTPQPVLFLSPHSAFAPGEAIRGGIPVIFPWFGARTPQVIGNVPYDEAATQPSHGFARTAPWQFMFAAAAGTGADVALHITLALGPDDVSRAAGFDHFRCVLEFTLARELAVRMTVANTGPTPLTFEQALHSYLHVADVRTVAITGLAGTEYLDKTDHFARRWQTADPLTITGETDRPYLNTDASVSVRDPQLARTLHIAKHGSATTVIWNPGQALAATLHDLGDTWPHFVCVEAANAADNRVTLAPGHAHVMSAHLAVDALAAE